MMAAPEALVRKKAFAALKKANTLNSSSYVCLFLVCSLFLVHIDSYGKHNDSLILNGISMFYVLIA